MQCSSTVRTSRLLLTALAFMLFGTSPVTTAFAADWTLDEAASELRFVGRQQGAPFTGRFEKFSAQVSLDPSDPSAGRIEATVDVRSADSRNRDRDEYMQAKSFFYSRKHPESRFESTAIRREGDAYVADGTLTLRGKTAPVTMNFTFAVASEGVARLE
ncbi:MAG: YceI family protein, partial [Pseudomonadota bacterium]